MANAEHLRRLLQGRKDWNQLRRENSEIQLDLSGADLSGLNLDESLSDSSNSQNILNLSGADLSEANLSGADLSGLTQFASLLIEFNGQNIADLSKVDLSRADLSGAKLSRAYLRGVKLNRADLSATNLNGVDLSGADLSGADLYKAELGGADLRDVKLHDAKLRDANLRNANLYKADLSGADLRDAKLSGADLRDTKLMTADLRGLDLSGTDLSGADLSGADLSGANLCRAKLGGANLRKTTLRRVNLCRTDLRDALLSKALLNEANLAEADLRGLDLSGADLNGADLSGTDLSDANLSRVVLSDANLSNANLSGLDLSDLDLSKGKLIGTDLSRAQVLGTSFEKAIFTGACLQDWNINSATKFEGAICDYIYLKANKQERRPREGNFNPGEFSALFQQAVDTVDLIFKDGIDWQAFFQSFQDLRSQYADNNLSIQAIERKQGEAFIVRVEVAENADKAAIEISAKELYETKLTILEQCYRAELQAKDGEIVAYREQSANLMKITEMLAARPPMSETPKYDFRGAQFAGGYVGGNVEGDQIGGTINNYGSSAADITRLITALREHAQAFPDEQKDDALDTLDDLEGDLAKEEPDPGRIGRRLKRLAAISTALTIGTTGFAADLVQLAETLNVPLPKIQVEQVQPDQLPPGN